MMFDDEEYEYINDDYSKPIIIAILFVFCISLIGC
jgi:hypothetical protein